jgi:hypothetical protein
VAAGAYFSLRVRSIQNDLQKPPPPTITPAERDRRRSEGDKAEKLQWIGYGVGAAALTGAGVLYWLSRDEATPQVSFFLPAGGRDTGTGLVISGRY